VGQQQVVEIAKVLSLDARIIIMDEPTSAISEREIYVLFELVKNLTKKNVAIVYITHKLDELFKIADSVTVLRDGKCVASRRIEEVDHDDVVRMMVGRDLNNYFIKAKAVESKPAMSAKNISLAYPDRSSDFLINNVEFSVHKGEVLGIFGLMGAGRTELFETIFGLHPETSSGQIILDGEEISIKSPGEAIRAGIGLVPEDRKLIGLVLNMAVQANITLASLRESVRMALISQKREKEIAEELIKQLQIKTPSPNEIVKNLSGGNQQKVIIAKWLATKPKILLLDEPTRGVDVNAKNEIYRLISELIKQKLAIIMISSELREILAISDRIMVLSEGRKTAEFVQEKANQEKIMNAAIPRSM
jgi:ribose transport system ATP-binding protein